MKIDIENSVLCGLIFDNMSFFENEIDPDIFTAHRKIVFEGIKKLISSGVEADMVSLFELLKGSVKASDLDEIIDGQISCNTQYHISELQKARIRREMYKAYTNAAAMCKDGLEPSEIALKINSALSNSEPFEPIRSEEAALTVLDKIIDRIENGTEQGIKSGLSKLDYFTNGFLPGEFIVIAGRPGMGKTSLAMNLAKNYAFRGYPGHIFSLEMPNDQLVQRMICDIGSVESPYMFQSALKKTNTEIIKKISDASYMIKTLPILWDDSARMTIDSIYSRARKSKTVDGIKWIIIDHLGKIKGWNRPGQECKAEITAEIAAIARDLKITVIVLSQLNREIEKRANRVPQMSDLRDAGSIEQDCDIAIFPDVPTAGTDETHGDQYNDATLYIVKNRRGRKGAITGMKWQGHFYRYSDERY